MEAVAWTLVGIFVASTLGNLYWLGSKIDTLGGRLDSRIDALDSKLSGRIDGLSGRIEGLAARFDTHIDQHAP